MSDLLTGADFIRRLESLNLLARRVLGGSLQSDRKSRRKGAGITFAEHSEYQLGDDWRAIDWRVYARNEQLMIKLFEMEEDMTLHLLLDVSPSMARKFDLARQIAAALGYIALSNQDAVAIHGLSDQLQDIQGKLRGKSQIFKMLHALEQVRLAGQNSDLTQSVRHFLARQKKKSLVVVLSDFLMPEGVEQGLKMLDWHGHDVCCLQVQSPEDQTCDFRGDADLVCVESGKRQRVTISASEARRYEEAVQRWNADVRKSCLKRGIGYGSTTTELAFDAFVRKLLEQGGLVS